MTTASKRGKRNRQAGKRWERQVAKDLRPIFGNVWRGWQSRTGDNQADNEGVPCFWVECKYKLSASITAALKQAADDTDGRMPLAVVKYRDRTVNGDRRKPLVLVALHTQDWYRFRRKVNRAVVAGGLDSTGAATVDEYMIRGRHNMAGKFQLLDSRHPGSALHFHEPDWHGVTVISYPVFIAICESWMDSLLASIDRGNHE